MNLFGNHAELLPTGTSRARYITHAITPETADRALSELLASTEWSQPTVIMFGKRSPLPRLVAWVADQGVMYSYTGLSTAPQPWTPLLEQLRYVAERHAAVRFNTVLLNAYLDGSHKVSWHSDNEPLFGPRPTIASLSLGAERRFKMRSRLTGEVVEQRLGHGSLLVMSGDCQRDWEHEVPREARVTLPRVNLTFRFVTTANNSPGGRA